MTNAETVIQQLENDLAISRAEACQKMIRAMGHAIVIPLNGIKMGSALLQNHAHTPQVYAWAEECHQKSLAWLSDFQQLQATYLNHPDGQSADCQPVFDSLQALFAGSTALILSGSQLHPLIEDRLAEAYRLVLRELTHLDQIQAQLQAQDLSWLLPHLA